MQVHYASVLEQHETIVNAVVNRDLKRLRQTIIEHINIFKGAMVNYMAAF